MFELGKKEKENLPRLVRSVQQFPIVHSFIYLFDLVKIRAFFGNGGVLGCTKLLLNKVDAMKVRFFPLKTFFRLMDESWVSLFLQLSLSCFSS